MCSRREMPSYAMMQGGRHRDRPPFHFSTTNPEEFAAAEEWAKANLHGRWSIGERIIRRRQGADYVATGVGGAMYIHVTFFRLWDATDAVHFKLRWCGSSCG